MKQKLCDAETLVSYGYGYKDNQGGCARSILQAGGNK